MSPGEIGLEDAIKLLAEKVAKVPSRRGRQPAAKKAAASTKAVSSKEAPAKDPADGSKAKAKSSKAAAAEGATEKPVRKSRKLVVASEDAEGAADVNLLSGSKPRRTRKAAVNGHVSEDEAAAAVEAPIKAKRGRPKKSEGDQAAAGDLLEAKPRRTRKAAGNGQVSQDEAAAAVEAPIKAKRGRPKKVAGSEHDQAAAGDLSEAKANRSRKAAGNGQVSQDEAAAAVDAPEKAKRSRPKKAELASAAA